jgi:hypothetical protein
LNFELIDVVVLSGIDVHFLLMLLTQHPRLLGRFFAQSLHCEHDGHENGPVVRKREYSDFKDFWRGTSNFSKSIFAGGTASIVLNQK